MFIALALILPSTARGEATRISLSIERAQQLANEGADQVKAMTLAATAALRAADEAKSKFLPHLSGSVSEAYLVNPPVGVTVVAGSLGTLGTVHIPTQDLVVVANALSTYFKSNLTFTQPLYAWGKIRAAMDLASLEARVAGLRASGARLDAARQASTAYFSALLSRRSAAILAEVKDIAAQIVSDSESALAEGLATKEQLLSSKADLADLESKIVQAGESETSALEALAVLTGLDALSIELVSDFRETLPAISEEGIKKAAPAFSTAFGEAQVRLVEAGRKVTLEKGSSLFRPDLAFFASLDASGQGLPYSGSSWNDTWVWDLSLGISANIDFLDGGASAARRKEAAANRDAAAVSLEAEGKALRLESRRAIDAARQAEAALGAAEARGAWAVEALRNARSEASDQMISRSALNGATIREASARLEELSARFTLEQAIADLERLRGEGRP